jgi:hypothetical protein
MSEQLDGRVMALTERKGIMTFPEREHLPSQAAIVFVQLPALSPQAKTDGKRTLGRCGYRLTGQGTSGPEGADNRIFAGKDASSRCRQRSRAA